MESLLLPISFPTTNKTTDNGYSTFSLPKSETAAKINRGEYMRQYMAKNTNKIHKPHENTATRAAHEQLIMNYYPKMIL